MSLTTGSLLKHAVLAALLAGLFGVISIANFSWVWPLIFLGRLSRGGMIAISASGIAVDPALMGLSSIPALVILAQASSACSSP